MSEPVLVGLLFADRIITEDNGKKAIIGTFNTFHSHHFPVVFNPWFIYAAFTNLAGPHNFSLTLVSEQDERSTFELNGQVEIRDKSDVVEICPVVAGVSIEHPGKYYLTLTLDGLPLGGRVLNVHKHEPPHE